MVLLEDKVTRDTIGIDSFKRAIIYSAFLLRRNYLELTDDRKKNLIQIAPRLTISNEEINSLLIVTATLTVDLEVLSKVGNFLPSIISEAGNLIYQGENLPASQDGIAPIKADFPEIDTLEKYLLWACYEYQLDIFLNKRTEKYRDVVIDNRFNSNSEQQQITINAAIPYNHSAYLASGNYLQAIGNEIVETDLPESLDLIEVTDNLFVNSDGNFILN